MQNTYPIYSLDKLSNTIKSKKTFINDASNTDELTTCLITNMSMSWGNFPRLGE